jgi:hypothetical protein
MHREQTHTATQRLRRPHCTKYSYILTSSLSNQDSDYTGIKIAKPDDTTTGAMDNQGSLTKSGLLYEENYQEWESRLWDMLKLLDADMDAPFGRLGNGTPISTLLESLVIPRLLLIVTQSAHMANRSQWRKHLLPGLKLAAVPFRMMGLPVDVRTRIWRFAIDSQQELTTYNITADSPFEEGRIRSVTRASGEVRAETLAISWADVIVKFEPSAVQRYNLEQLSSTYASRFHQLETFEQSDRVSRGFSVYAFFPVSVNGRLQSRVFLTLKLFPLFSIQVKDFHPAPLHTIQLAPSALRKIQSHLDLASRLFSSSCSSTAFVVMA